MLFVYRSTIDYSFGCGYRIGDISVPFARRARNIRNRSVMNAERKQEEKSSHAHHHQPIGIISDSFPVAKESVDFGSGRTSGRQRRTSRFVQNIHCLCRGRIFNYIAHIVSRDLYASFISSLHFPHVQVEIDVKTSRYFLISRFHVDIKRDNFSRYQTESHPLRELIGIK